MVLSSHRNHGQGKRARVHEETRRAKFAAAQRTHAPGTARGRGGDGDGRCRLLESGRADEEQRRAERLGTVKVPDDDRHQGYRAFRATCAIKRRETSRTIYLLEIVNI